MTRCAAALAMAGVDGIVTDVPDLVRAAIDGHG